MLSVFSNISAGFSTMVVRVFDRGRNQHAIANVENMKKIACGCMNGTAAFMPLLHPPSLGLRGMFYMDLGVFSLSLAAFCFLHISDIVKNSPYTLTGGTVLFILAATSSQTSLEQFTPYIPLSVALTLSVTVHVVPKVLIMVHQFIYGESEHAVRLPDFSGASAGSNSLYSMRSFRADSDIEAYLDSQPSAFLFSHMDGEWSQNIRHPSSLSDVTEIDLELGFFPHAAAPVYGEETDLLL